MLAFNKLGESDYQRKEFIAKTSSKYFESYKNCYKFNIIYYIYLCCSKFDGKPEVVILGWNYI